MRHFFVLCLSIILFYPSSYAGSLSNQTVEDRILGGITLSSRTYQLMSLASVRFSNIQGQFHLCGGFIINKYWLGSAAQCLAGQTIQNTVVAVGSASIAGGTIYNLNRIEMHQNYNELTLANDVALVRTATEITFIANVVGPAVLSTEVIPGAKHVTIYGWGRTAAGSNLASSALRQDFITMTNEQCQANFPFVARRFIFDRNICTNKASFATCPGDAGGPIYEIDSPNVIGILSWVEPCAPGQTNVNSRISSYINWISNITSADG